MPQKFKSFLSKIITDKRLKIILFSFIVLFSIFIPLKRADAVWGIGDVGLFDLTETQLDALDFIDSVVLRLIVDIATLLVVSEAFTLTSAHLLEWAMNLPINIGTTNLLVTSGWQFTLGLTNLFFILAFVIIALAHILGLSTFEMKKALPKLIIIALLVNFSLVFIGIFVDIVNIFQSALLDALGENLTTLAIQPLLSSTKSVAAWFLLIPVAAIASSFAPFWNIVALAAIGTVFFADIAIGGVFLKGLFLIIINFLIGGIFSFYFVLFLMRIAMIWILAIFSPLAFFSYILPQTQGIWKEWYKTLSEWLILGIVAIFLTGLGLKFFATIGDNAILNWGGNINTGRGSLPAFIYNYLFMLVYMGITFFYSMKYVPQMATTLLNYGKSFAGGITKIARARTMKRDVWGPAAEEAEKQLARPASWGQKLSQRLMKRAEGAEEGGKTVRARILRWTGRRAGGFGKAVGSFRPGLIEYAAQQRRTAKPKGWDQMTDIDKSSFVDSMTQDKEKIVLVDIMKSEKSYQRTPDDFRERMRSIRDKFAGNLRYTKEVSNLMDAEPDKVTAMLKIDVELTGLTGKEKEDKKIEVEKKIDDIVSEFGIRADEAAGVLHAQGFSSKDVAEVAKSSVKSLSFQLASRKMGSSQLRALQNNFDEGTVRAVLDEKKGLNTIKDQKDLEKIYKVNPRLVRWAFQSPAGREMLNWADRFKEPTGAAAAPPGAPPSAPSPGTPAEKRPNYLKAKKDLDYLILERKKLNYSIKKVREEKTKAEGSAIPATEEWKEVERLEKELGKLIDIKEVQLKSKIKYLQDFLKKGARPSLSPSIRKAIKNSSNFDELYKAIDNSKGIQGTKEFHSSKKLKEIIEDVRAGKKTLSHVTGAGELRRVVRKLIQSKKNKKS